MKKYFGQRVRRAAQHAGLGVSDLQWFFDRDYKTVREWILHDREPEGGRREDALSRLAHLEALVSAKAYFPIPIVASKRLRSSYMRVLGGGNVDVDRAEFFAPRAPRKRVVDRISKKAKRTAKAKGI